MVKDNNDRQQFTEQIEAARDVTGKTPEVAGADSGYYSGKELETMAAVATTVLVPVRGQVHPSEGKALCQGSLHVRGRRERVCLSGGASPDVSADLRGASLAGVPIGRRHLLCVRALQGMHAGPQRPQDRALFQ